VTGPAWRRPFRRLWAAYAISAYGSGFALGAFPLIAVVALHEGPAAVSALSAAGLAVGAVVAVPLGPWVERRRKRPVMVAMDVLRFAALLTVPIAYVLGVLDLAQLIVVTVVVAAAKIAFNAASGAYLRALVPRESLVGASSRFEATTWTALTIGPPLGGAAIGILGPVVTVVADAVSYLLSALGVAAIGGREPSPSSPEARVRAHDLLVGWRHLLTHPTLRPLFLNTLLVNGLIMTGEPLMAVLMLGRLGFAPWQYGLAFAAPCLGGFVAARAAPRLVGRFGADRVLWWSGVLRVCFPLALAFVGPGTPGLLLVIAAQLGLVAACGVYNPVLAARRLELTPADRVARTLTAWSVTSSASIAVLTALGGVIGELVGPRAAVAVAGVALLATPILLPRRTQVSDCDRPHTRAVARTTTGSTRWPARAPGRRGADDMPDQSTDSGPVFRLIYRSRLTIPDDDVEAEVANILAKARTKNPQAGITGALVVWGTSVVQTLEGEEGAVRGLYDVISKDPRHEHVELVETTPGVDRTFGRWSMARVADDDDADMPVGGDQWEGAVDVAARRLTSPEEEAAAKAMRDRVRGASA
jgi:MFS family permease